MVSRWVRTWSSQALRPLLMPLIRLGLTPNMLTAGSLVCFVVAGAEVARGAMVAACGLLVMGGIADGIDGEVARLSATATPFGAFLDSICDHAGDFAFSLGLIWLYLNQQNRFGVVLVVVALFGSMLGSQIRSRAGMVGLDTKDVGIATRAERLTVLIVGIVTAHLLAALWVLAVLTNLAAAQRFAVVLRRLAARRAARAEMS